MWETSSNFRRHVAEKIDIFWTRPTIIFRPSTRSIMSGASFYFKNFFTKWSIIRKTEQKMEEMTPARERLPEDYNQGIYR